MTGTGIVVVGGGGHAAVVIDSLLAMQLRVCGFVDRAVDLAPIAGVPHLGGDEILESLDRHQNEVIVALGDNRTRKRLAERAAALGLRLVNAIHPTACISPSATLGYGIALMAQSVINARTTVGDGAIVNTAASVDHDCRIAPFVHVAPGSHLAGYVDVEEGALVGVGSSVGRGRPVTIGAWSVLGTGSVAVVDVPRDAVLAGNPARAIPRSATNPKPQES